MLSISFYLEVICLVAGLVFYKKLSPYYIKWFVPFIFITVLVELPTNFNWIIFKGNNLWFYNIFTSCEFLFYFIIFYHAISNPRWKKLLLYLFPAYIIVALVNILFIQGIYKFHTISYRIASVIIIFYCFLYFKQLLSNDIEENILRIPFFWICAGLLIFYAGFFLYFCAFDYIVYTKTPYSVEYWRIISRTLNILLYGLFLTALLCNLKGAKY